MDKENERQYTLDIVASFAERTIKRLWIVIIILTALLFASNAAWIWYESQFTEEEITQDVTQNATNGKNYFAGGDLMYGDPKD